MKTILSGIRSALSVPDSILFPPYTIPLNVCIKISDKSFDALDLWNKNYYI